MKSGEKTFIVNLPSRGKIENDITFSCYKHSINLIMDKYFIDKKGKAEEYVQGVRGKKDVHFPLCLAVKYGHDVSMDCADFLLNTTTGELFIPTDSPLPVGSRLKVNFYIPPNTKMLAEFRGRVVTEGTRKNITGNFIKISDFWHRKLPRLEAYLEEKQHLVDQKV